MKYQSVSKAVINLLANFLVTSDNPTAKMALTKHMQRLFQLPKSSSGAVNFGFESLSWCHKRGGGF